MNWTDLGAVGDMVAGALPGAAIATGVAMFASRQLEARLSEKLRQETEQEIATLRAQFDADLARLNAQLQHQNLLLQRMSDIEVDGLRKCWDAAYRVFYTLNGVRPSDVDLDNQSMIGKAVAELREATNDLLRRTGEFEPFLDEDVIASLREIRTLGALEASQAARLPTHAAARGHWFDQGEQNRVKVGGHMDALRQVVRRRFEALRGGMPTGRSSDGPGAPA